MDWEASPDYAAAVAAVAVAAVAVAAVAVAVAAAVAAVAAAVAAAQSPACDWSDLTPSSCDFGYGSRTSAQQTWFLRASWGTALGFDCWPMKSSFAFGLTVTGSSCFAPSFDLVHLNP